MGLWIRKPFLQSKMSSSGSIPVYVFTPTATDASTGQVHKVEPTGPPPSGLSLDFCEALRTGHDIHVIGRLS